jgi:hypothetical protein
MAQQPPVGQGLLIIEASRSRSDTPHSVGLLWTSDQPDADTSTWQHTNTHKRQTPMPPEGFEPTIPASERPLTHALDGAATGIGNSCIHKPNRQTDRQASKQASKEVKSNPNPRYTATRSAAAWAPHHLCYRLAVFFRHHVIAPLFPRKRNTVERV